MDEENPDNVNSSSYNISIKSAIRMKWTRCLMPIIGRMNKMIKIKMKNHKIEDSCNEYIFYSGINIIKCLVIHSSYITMLPVIDVILYNVVVIKES